MLRKKGKKIKKTVKDTEQDRTAATPTPTTTTTAIKEEEVVATVVVEASLEEGEDVGKT